MSFKTFCVLLFIFLIGVSCYIKYLAQGNPNSSFNQSTRYTLADTSWSGACLGCTRPVMRAIGTSKAAILLLLL